jgi:hypothetical protein
MDTGAEGCLDQIFRLFFGMVMIVLVIALAVMML